MAVSCGNLREQGRAASQDGASGVGKDCLRLNGQALPASSPCTTRRNSGRKTVEIGSVIRSFREAGTPAGEDRPQRRPGAGRTGRRPLHRLISRGQADGVTIDVGCSRPARVLRTAGGVPATDRKSGVPRTAATHPARNTQRCRRHSRYPEGWPEGIVSLDSGNLREVRRASPVGIRCRLPKSSATSEPLHETGSQK